ncbi:MAG: ABC transporter permease [Bauldia sp.]
MAVVDVAPQPSPAAVRRRFLSPLNQRRWRTFKAHRRGYWSLWIFGILFGITVFAEFLVNDRPIVISYNGELLFPALVDYPESTFGGFLATTDFRDPYIQREIEANGWMVWTPIRYSFGTFDRNLSVPTPAPPSWTMSREEFCAKYPLGLDDPNCTIGNYHWLGTDDQGRDVLARAIYGFRISVVFGVLLTIGASIIGVIAGAVQGYYGGWVDLLFQRFLEVWGAIPTLYVILIIFTVFVPSFWILLLILLIFSWTALVGVIRAEFLRARNFEYVAAARALGVSNRRIMFRHLLPNGMVATLTLMPFILNGSIATLATLDFLGFGLPPGSASLGEVLNQAKDNPFAIWLGLTGFFTTGILLSLLIFVGEGVRNAFDPRKTFAAATPA